MGKMGQNKETWSYKPQNFILIFDPQVTFKSYLKAVACHLWLWV